ARDIFAVETPRSHYDYAAAAPKVSREEDAVMPESVDRYLIVARCGFPIIPAFDFKFNGATDEFDEQEEDEIGGANKQAILQRIRGETGERVGAIDIGRRLHALVRRRKLKIRN